MLLRGVVMFTLGALINVPSNLGYAAVALFVGIEASGVPVPGETALISAAILAHDGQLSIELVILIAATAAIVGDNIGYLIGARFGRRLITRPGRTQTKRLAALDRGNALFARHGAKAVFLGRWIAGLRIWASWLAGMSEMPWRVFLLWNALGGIAWATSFGILGYALGDAAAKLVEKVGLVAAAVVLIGLFIGLRVMHRRSARAAPRD